ncbi:hypothetical protein EV179_004940 [Coemansia sp. RSA 487]|nr:hypothetical protein LPJ74_003646 [Coemansia sp. RSA 1843]KAJ2212078.1 hypothetical protein EV179_004940 [Coemansia sp. RSA 487]
MEFSSALEFTDNSPYLSGSDAQKTMPITPNMGMDAFFATGTSGMGSVFHNSSTAMLPISVINEMAPPAAMATTAEIPVSMTAPQAAPIGVDAARIHNDLAEIFGDAQMFDNAGNQAAVCEYPPISFGATPNTVASDDFMAFSRPLDKVHDNFFNEIMPSASASPAHSNFAAPMPMPAQPAPAQHPLLPDMGGDAFASPEMVAAAMAAAVAATSTATPSAGAASFSLPPGQSPQAMFSPAGPGFAGLADGALFGHPGYADGGITAANHAFLADDAAASAMGSSKTEDIGMRGHAQVGSIGNLSPFMLPPEMLDIATPPSMQSANSITVSSGRSITSGFGNISLDADHQAAHSFQPPRRAASYASRLSRMRPKRSLSSGKIANARMSPFASGPSTSVHPYMAHRCTSPGGSTGAGELLASPCIDRLYSHSRSESDALIAGLAGTECMGGPVTDLSRAQSAISVQNSPSGWGVASAAASVVDEDDSSSSSHASDNELSDHTTSSTLKRGGETSGSGRIALTNEQREIFFRWLFQNAHDPKPKGKERDRLRSIGNMSRGRFKTWFANARRRYFNVTTEADGKQMYTINERFRIACQRSNIKLE